MLAMQEYRTDPRSCAVQMSKLRRADAEGEAGALKRPHYVGVPALLEVDLKETKP